MPHLHPVHCLRYLSYLPIAVTRGDLSHAGAARSGLNGGQPAPGAPVRRLAAAPAAEGRHVPGAGVKGVAALQGDGAADGGSRLLFMRDFGLCRQGPLWHPVYRILYLRSPLLYAHRVWVCLEFVCCCACRLFSLVIDRIHL